MVNRKDIPVVVTQTLHSRVTLKDVIDSEDGGNILTLPFAYECEYMTIPDLLRMLRKMVVRDPRIDESLKNLILMSIGSLDTWIDFDLKVEEA